MGLKGFGQWIVLIQRNFQVIFADKVNLSLIIFQVPLISMLIIVAFYNFEHDKQNFDEASRILYYFGIMKAPLELAEKTINIDTLHRYAKNLAIESNPETRVHYIQNTINPFFEKKNIDVPVLKEDIQFMSDIAGMRRGSVYFLLVASSIWFGIMGSCKEVVTEQSILKRESRSYLFIFPYLLAKFCVVTLILCLQTGLLSLMVVPLLLKLSLINGLWIWLILWIAAFVSASLGLFISCVVNSYRVALTLIPLLMIPQLLFGGLLRPQIDLKNDIWSDMTNILSALTIQRWAFEAILSKDIYAEGGILKLQVNPRSHGELNLIQTTNISLVHSFFKPRKWGTVKNSALWLPLIYLLSASLIFFISGYLALRQRFT
ncbi:MAG: ABC transporter permease [Thiomargarita sp.]|nr:ABC transporter permease [Thiomargarita sp.]